MKLRTLTFIVVATGLLAASALSGAADGPVANTAAKAKHCRQVDVKLQPDGEGSAVGIRVWNVGCRKARRVARHCIQGKVDDGWAASANADLSKITLKSGKRKITFMPAGGGGCVAI